MRLTSMIHLYDRELSRVMLLTGVNFDLIWSLCTGEGKGKIARKKEMMIFLSKWAV